MDDEKSPEENPEEGWSRFLDSMPPVEQQVLEIRSKLPELCDTHRWIPRFLLALRVSHSIRQACYAADITRAMVYRVKNAHSEFAKAMAEAEEDAIDWYVEEARRRALRSSDMLLWNMLKAHRPEIYREPKGGANVAAVIKVQIGDKVKMIDSVDDLSDDELRTLASGKLTIEGDITKLLGSEEDESDADAF
jgi:hypothetical protein